MFQTFVFLIFLCEAHAILWPKQNTSATSNNKYQLWQANIQGVNLSLEFEKKIAEKNVWHQCDNNIDFLLNGNETEYWNKFLESQNISYEVLVEDVQKAIEKEDLMKKFGDWRRGGNINWSSYPRLRDIYDYLKSIAAADTTFSSLKSIGKTTHKTDIMMLKLSNGNVTNEAFLIVAGMHAREWEAVVALLYFIEQIAKNFNKQPNYIRDKDWYIIPVANPDGYEYSMTKDRLWIKNRHRFSGPCDGVDLNRNFDHKWSQVGASIDMCSVHYCGIQPFSEQETIAIRDVVNARHYTGYVAIHSHGSAVLFPWIYDGTKTSNTAAHVVVAKEMVMAMRKVTNEHYRAGSVSLLHMRKCSGNAVDWAFSRGIEHTYAVETRGSGLFVLDTNQLLPAAEEIAVGLKKMAEVISPK